MEKPMYIYMETVEAPQHSVFVELIKVISLPTQSYILYRSTLTQLLHTHPGIRYTHSIQFSIFSLSLSLCDTYSSLAVGVIK
jgi:hypothetical protein